MAGGEYLQNEIRVSGRDTLEEFIPWLGRQVVRPLLREKAVLGLSRCTVSCHWSLWALIGRRLRQLRVNRRRSPSEAGDDADQKENAPCGVEDNEIR